MENRIRREVCRLICNKYTGLRSKTGWIGEGVLRDIRHTRDKENYYEDLIAVLPSLQLIKQKLLAIKHHIEHPRKRLKSKKQSPDFERALLARIELLLAGVPKNAAQAQKAHRLAASNGRDTTVGADASFCETVAPARQSLSRRCRSPPRVNEPIKYEGYEEVVEPQSHSSAWQQTVGWTTTKSSLDTADPELARLRALLSDDMQPDIQPSYTSQNAIKGPRIVPDKQRSRRMASDETTPAAATAQGSRPLYQFVTYNRHALYDRPDIYNDKPGSGIDVIQAVINNMLIWRPDAVFGPVHLPTPVHGPVWHAAGYWPSIKQVKEKEGDSTLHDMGVQKTLIRDNGKYTCA